MSVAALGGLVFALVYWRLLPPSARPASLLALCALLYWASAPSLALNLALTLLVLAALRFGPLSARSWPAIALPIVALLLNKYAGLPAFQVVGLSYVAFRLISLSRDVGKRQDAPPSILDALVYVLFPTTFLSGPIEPFERFRKIEPPARLERMELFASLTRIVIGLAKKLLIADPLGAFANTALAPDASASMLWPGLFAYSLFVYLDFSAYSDLAIGGARLFGYKLGENFDWPYLSANISEFWTRWHISLSQFLRDHVFLPLSGRALTGGLAAWPLLVGIMSSLVTMTLCGMWHGSRGSFAVWGFAHGVLIGLHQIYRQKVLGRMKAKQRIAFQKKPAYRAFCTLLTFVGVSLLWVLFRFPLPEAGQVYGRLFGAFIHF